MKTKLYLYDSSKETAITIRNGKKDYGYRGTDYSDYLLSGDAIVEDLSNELDTAEITIYGIARAEEFTPETKFIMDKVDGDEIVETYHWCVEKDIVEKPILADDAYYSHHLYLYEPSVVAQKRLCDNMSATYKIKSVTLEATTTRDENLIADDIETSTDFYEPSNNFGLTESGGTRTYFYGKKFVIEGNPSLVKANGEAPEKNYYYRDIEDFKVSEGLYQANIKLPKMAIYRGVSGTKTYANRGYVSYSYKVRQVSEDGTVERVVASGDIIENGTFDTNGWVLEYQAPNNSKTDIISYFRKYANPSASAPTYETGVFNVLSGFKYFVDITLYEFPDNIDFATSEVVYKSSDITEYSTYIERYRLVQGTQYEWKPYSASHINMGVALYSADTSYFIYSADDKARMFDSAAPYSALFLLQKAVMGTYLYSKKTGYTVRAIDEVSPFYVDEEYVTELSQTDIIETFYNQKNLWEVLTDIGYYIHAVPELRFGKDDRFVITFNKLGRTDEKADGAQHSSIMNFRGVDDYISALSSYVTNMVQLGGSVAEWTPCKANTENYLIYTDKAVVKTSKPIIEIIGWKAKCNSDSYTSIGIENGATADLTNFIYEKNIYSLLPIEYDTMPNKGIAMYYENGDTDFLGGDYQLPRQLADQWADYSFKKILWCAFHGTSSNPYSGYKSQLNNPTNPWVNISPLDFSYYVEYRTKDSVRQVQSRPDLRKYLLMSKYDAVPIHEQFNNQEDTLVDSVAFGSNIYGKLIRTGNTNYQMNEWVDGYENAKHKGELYRINNDLYYVSKVTHIFYPDHIESQVDYSNNYNQLSQVIGIPSEPRYYEISEQSSIRRDVSINEYLLLTTGFRNQGDTYCIFDYTHISNLMLADGTGFAKYAITTFKGDGNASTSDTALGLPDWHIDTLHSVNAYSSENTLTYEWDMADNYSAGDQVIATEKTAYKSLKAVQYTDRYGKAALMDFYLLGDMELTADEIQALPVSPVDTSVKSEVVDLPVYATNNSLLTTHDGHINEFGLALIKDSREAISLNYNIQLLTDSDTFVLSKFVFTPEKSDVKLVLLSEEVNKLSNGYINTGAIITPINADDETLEREFTLEVERQTEEYEEWDGKTGVRYFGVKIRDMLSSLNDNHFIEQDNPKYQRVKAIAIIYEGAKLVVARNIPSSFTKAQAVAPWYFVPPKKDFFSNKQ